MRTAKLTSATTRSVHKTVWTATHTLLVRRKIGSKSRNSTISNQITYMFIFWSSYPAYTNVPWRYTSSKNKIHLHRLFTAVLFVTGKFWKWAKYSYTGECLINYGTSTQWSYMHLWKEWGISLWISEEYLYELAWNISRINTISYLKVKKSKGQAFTP